MVAFNLTESPTAGSSVKQQAKMSDSKDEDAMKANQSRAWLPEDWKVELKSTRAGSPNGKKYWCYLSPAGHKFYSKPEVLRHLNVNDKKSSSKQKNFSIGENSKEHASVEKVEPEELPPGWVSKLKVKGKRRDWFHTDPVTGITFRSRKDALRYLETGEISRHAIRPKNSSKNDSEIISNPPPSAAKMQELSDRATRRQLLSGNGNSLANSSSVSTREGNSTARVTRASSNTTDIVTPKAEGKGSRELCSLEPPITDETSIRRVTRGSAKIGKVFTPAIESPQRKHPLKIAALGKGSFELRNLISPKTEGDTSTRRVTRGYSKQVSPSSNHPVDHIASSNEHPGMSGLDMPNPYGTSSKRVTRGSAKTMAIDTSVEAKEISDLIESAEPEPRDLKRKRADIVNARTKPVAAKKNPSSANGSNTKQGKQGYAQNGVEEHITGCIRKNTSEIANQKEFNTPRRSSRRLASVASDAIVNLNYGEPTQNPIVASTQNNEDILALNMIVDSVAQWATQQLAAIPELTLKSSITPVNQANEELSNMSNVLLENQSEPKFVSCLDAEKKQDVPENTLGALPAEKKQDDPENILGALPAEKKQDDPENLLGTLPDNQTTDHNENVEILESDKMSNLNQDPDPSFVFGDSWADPCLEFAYRTLTGALPIDDIPEYHNYFQLQSDDTPTQMDNGLGVPKIQIPSTFETDDDPSQCDSPVTPVFGQRSRSFMSIDVNLPLGPQESGVDDSNKNHK